MSSVRWFFTGLGRAAWYMLRHLGGAIAIAAVVMLIVWVVGVIFVVHPSDVATNGNAYRIDCAMIGATVNRFEATEGDKAAMAQWGLKEVRKDILNTQLDTTRQSIEARQQLCLSEGNLVWGTLLRQLLITVALVILAFLATVGWHKYRVAHKPEASINGFADLGLK